MKFNFSTLVAFSILIQPLNLLSQFQEDSQENYSFEYSGQSNVPSTMDSDSRTSFWTLEGEGDWISKSRFTTPENAGQKIGFAEADIFLSYTRLLNSCEGIGIGVGYSYTNIDWDQNPFFDQESFNDITFSLDGFTKRFRCWDWKGSVSVDMQTTDFGNNDYNMYNMLVWGRYEFCNRYIDNLGLHIGVVGRTGLEQTIAWPILGFDFRLRRNWKVNLIYPVNMSLVYTISDNWSLALAGRIWNSRHRISKHENLPKGIFEYRNTGAEIALNYECSNFANATIHVGSTLGSGDLKIVNSRNHTIRHNKFHASAYVGGAFNLKF